MLKDIQAIAPSVVVNAIVDPYYDQGYADAAVATAGVQLNITKDWGGDLVEAAAASVGESTDTFELSGDADPWSVRVHLDRVETSHGWTFDEDLDVVVFDEANIPVGGTEVLIDYTVGDTCSQ